VKSFEELDGWQKGQKLVLSVYEVTSRFPMEERFGVVSQLRRGLWKAIDEGFHALPGDCLGLFGGNAVLRTVEQGLEVRRRIRILEAEK